LYELNEKSRDLLLGPHVPPRPVRRWNYLARRNVPDIVNDVVKGPKAGRNRVERLVVDHDVRRCRIRSSAGGTNNQVRLVCKRRVGPHAAVLGVHRANGQQWMTVNQERGQPTPIVTDVFDGPQLGHPHGRLLPAAENEHVAARTQKHTSEFRKVPRISRRQ